MTIEDVKKIISPIHRRVMLMIARSTIKVAKAATAQITTGVDEVRDDLDRLQEFGFASMPEEGAEALIVFVGGNRDHGVIVATGDKRSRPALDAGETAIYTKDVVIKIKADKTVEIIGATKMKFPCDLEVTGKITATGIVQGSDVKTTSGTKLSTHTHPAGALVAPNGPVTGASGSPTPGS